LFSIELSNEIKKGAYPDKKPKIQNEGNQTQEHQYLGLMFANNRGQAQLVSISQDKDYVLLDCCQLTFEKHNRVFGSLAEFCSG